jgi:uncharacterized protein (DUF427 family)
MSLTFGRAPLAPPGGKFTLLYFPLEDFDQEALEAGSEDDGVRRRSLSVDDERFENCVSPSPADETGAELLPGHVTLDFKTPERWFEEDDPIYAHTRDPYHRVDVRSSSRAVEVRLGDQLVAASSRPKLLFETSNPVRYYLPFEDVRIELLELSETVSECPYKGDGQHWHLRAGGREVRDAAWSLPHPCLRASPRPSTSASTRRRSSCRSTATGSRSRCSR